LYVATRTEGLYDFPLGGGPPRRIDDPKKMPAEGVEACALYDGRLYAALDGGYLVSLDPESGRFDVLASSRRREKVSPFDDGDAFTVPFLAADPERRRLIFLLHQGRTKPDALNGLWSLDPKTTTFKRLLETAGAEHPLLGGPITDGHLLFSSSDKAVDFDLTRDKYTLLWGWLDAYGPALDPKNALCQEPYRAAGPMVYRDGWLWTWSPFSRFSITGKKRELLVAPQRKGDPTAGSAEALLPLGKDRMLYGSSGALWLVTLRKE
jgi:hypothetical protein